MCESVLQLLHQWVKQKWSPI